MRGKRNVDMPTEWRGLPERLRAATERLRQAHIECRPALEVIATVVDKDVLIYADPPYPANTLYERTARYYSHEMSDDDHIALIAALQAHPGPVLLSGYRCALYDDLLADWRRVDTEARAYRNAIRTESLWMNRVCVERRRDLFSLAGVTV
jgi:DNA adenine methylase